MFEKLGKFSPVCRSRLRTLLILAGVILGVSGHAQMGFLNFTGGILMLGSGILLHICCKANLQQDQALTRSGPYRWVRHPFYSANALIDFGLCLMIGRWDVGIVFAVCWTAAYLRQIKMEEAVLARLFGKDFQTYKKEVPALIPWKLRPSPESGETSFSFKNPNIDSGKEISRILRYTAYPFLLMTAFLVGKEGVDVFIDNSAAALIPPAMFLSFVWFSRVADSFVKGRRSTVANLMQRGSFRLFVDVALLGFLIIAEGVIPEINTPLLLWGSSGLILFLFLPCFWLLARRFPLALRAYRFRMVLEMNLLILMSVVGGLFYLILVPVFFYAPAIVYGTAETHKPGRLNIELVSGDLSPPLLLPSGMFRMVLSGFGITVLLLQEILQLSILKLG